MKMDKLIEILTLSFDSKKINLQVMGIILGLIGCAVVLLIGSFLKHPALIIIFTILAVLAIYISYALTGGAICRMIYTQTQGNKIKAAEAAKFAFDNFGALKFSPLLILLCGTAVLIGELAISFLGKIPLIGEVLLSLLVIPLLCLNVYLILFLFFGLLLIPAIVAVEKSKILATVNRVYLLLKKFPIQLVIYFSICFVVLAAIAGSLTILIIEAGTITSGILWPIGQKLSLLTQAGNLNLTAALNLAVVFAGVSVLIILLYLISYLGVLCQAISTSIYLALKDKV